MSDEFDMRAFEEPCVVLYVDLDGSNCGPGWWSVELILDGPVLEWDDDRIRREAARYYDVPLEQVGQPQRSPKAILESHLGSRDSGAS